MSNSSDKGIISNAVTEKRNKKVTQQLKPVKDKLIHKPKFSLIIHQDRVSHWQCYPFICLTRQRDLKTHLSSARLFLKSFKTANMQRPCSTLTLSACPDSAAQSFLCQMGHGSAFKRNPYGFFSLSRRFAARIYKQHFKPFLPLVHTGLTSL